MSDANFKWVATLSDGSTVVEEEGEYRTIPGERKPWVRLCTFLAENNFHLTSLRLNIEGRTIHMPRANFGRFSYNDVARAPLFYSLQYHIEGELAGGVLEQTTFIDLAAHYDDFVVHYIQDTTDGNNSWVVVTDDHGPMAPTPQGK